MCLYMEHSTPLVKADKDIKVYKIIDKGNKSLFKFFQYNPHQVYTLPRPLQAHSLAKNWLSIDKSVVEEGFHSYELLSTAQLRAKYEHYLKVVEFVIPAGEFYYKGVDAVDDPCYTSTSIRSGSLEPIHRNFFL